MRKRRTITKHPSRELWLTRDGRAFVEVPINTLNGYPYFRGYQSPAAHILLLETFRGPRPPGAMARHLDDNKLNRHISNLRWGTWLENAADAKRNGKIPGRKLDHTGRPYS